ncbi:hypothetical protein [Chitinophaga sp. MM2321]|uniref:hypothetical protein n=1 Tax=Chitinophaga sp. MM2321 TaxID=3137178 RepID=UPI0032D57989
MIAYNRQTLDNLTIQEEAATAFRKDCIDKDTYLAIKQAHQVNFYTPNSMIRIGLFILTSIIIIFSLGLISLAALDHTSAFTTIFIFFGIACYGALELFIKEKKVYQAGIDDALLWAAMLFFAGSTVFDKEFSATTYSLLALLLTLLATLRFGGIVTAAATYLAFLASLFCILMEIGGFMQVILPFLIMLVSSGVYIITRKAASKQSFRHYKHCLIVVEVLSLISLYLAGNYFVVRELSNEMFNMNLQPGQSIPGGWIFWILTFVIPPVYLYLGIRKKDAILLRTGLVLLAVIIFTIRQYHHVLPLETMMVLAGIIMTVGAWALIKYLHAPKHGFTYLETDEPGLADKLKIESLIIAQTFTPGPQGPASDVTFGGGTGGGGGASGEY